jgi:transposase
MLMKSTFPAIAAACRCSENMVHRVLRDYRTRGLEVVFALYPNKVQTPALAARILALSRTPPPEGRLRWTAALLAEAAVKQGITDHISTIMVSRIMKADSLRRGEPLARSKNTFFRKLTPAVERRILALSRTPPPPGCYRWTGKTLAQVAVEQGIVTGISPSAVRKLLHRAAGPDWVTPPSRRAAACAVMLNAAECQRLQAILLETPAAADTTPQVRRAKVRAAVLLLLSQNISGADPVMCVYSDGEIARRCNCTNLTVHNIRRKFCEAEAGKGLEAVLAW